MNRKKCFLKICLFFIVLTAVFALYYDAHAATMTESGTVTLRQNDCQARAITEDNDNFYILAQGSPSRVIKVRKSDMKEVGAVTLNSGENDGFGITNDGTYLYVVTYTSTAKLIRINKSTMQRVDAISLGTGVSRASAVTCDSTHLYVITDPEFGDTKLIKVAKSNMSITGTKDLTGCSRGRAIILHGDYLYVAGYSRPTTVAKIEKNNLSFTTRTLDGVYNGLGIETDGTHLYIMNFSNDESTSTLSKVRMTDLVSVQTIPLTGMKHAHDITSDGTYLYMASLTAPITVAKVKISTMQMEGSAVSMDLGNLNAASITNYNDSVYVGTFADSEPIHFIKLSKSNLAQTGCLVLGEANGSAITDDGANLYVINNKTNPAVVTKVRKSDNTRVDALTLNPEETNVSAVINDGTYLYAVTDTSPAKVVKVKMSDMTRVGAVNLSKNRAAAVTKNGDYLYVVTNTDPATVIKLNASNLGEVKTLTLNSGESYGKAVTNDGKYLYVATDTSSAKVVKVDMETMTRVSAVSLSCNNASAVSHDGTYLYVATNTAPTKVAKVNMDSMAETGSSISLPSGENYGKVILNDGEHLYIVNSMSPTKITKIRKSNMSWIESISLSSGLNLGCAIAGDTSYLYIVNNTAPTKVTRVSYIYEPYKYTVTFDTQGGSGVDPLVNVVHGSKIAAPAAPIKTGYTFAGWYKDDALTQAWNFASDTVTGPTTLYAKWAPATNTPYKVEHYLQNVTDDSYTIAGGDTENRTGTTGTTATATPKTYAGFTFNAGKSTTSGTIAPDGSLVLRLYYDRNTYTVSFDSNGGTAVPGKTGVRYGATITAPTAPTKTGYTFAGWFKNTALTQAWNFGTDTVTGPTTLYAKWNPNTNTQYTVEHYLQDVTGDSYTIAGGDTENRTGTTGATATATPKTYTGFTLNAGKSTQSGTIAPDGSLVLRLYYDRNTFTVSFELNGGTGVTNKTGIRYRATISAPTAPTKTGYSFAGWFKNTALTQAWNFGTDTVTGPTTLYAKWNPNTNTPYKVEHYLQDVTGTGYTMDTDATENLTGTTGETATATPKEYTGFKLNGSKSTQSDVIAPDGSLVLRLYYDRDTFTVSFESNGGTEVADIPDVRYGAAISEPAAPTKTTYGFAGWYKDSALTDAWDFVTDTVSGPTTLYAKWEINKYTVTFTNWNDSVLKTQIVEHGSGATAPADPTREGHSFTGWDTDFSNVTTDLTVKATFAINTYTVTFKNWDDIVLKTETVEHGSGATAPAEPTREGYYFTGWDRDFSNVTSELTVKATFAEIPTYEITLSVTGTYTFASLTVGYTTPASITVTVSKAGTGDITNLSAALGGTDADAFSLGSLSKTTLVSSTTPAAFTVQPKDALAPGTYNATVTVTADNGVSESFIVSFTVTPPVPAPGIPVLQTAIAGDGLVNLTWSMVESVSQQSADGHGPCRYYRVNFPDPVRLWANELN